MASSADVDVSVIELIPLTSLARVTDQASCFAAVGHHLVIGTHDGNLLSYTVNASKGTLVPALSLVMKKVLGRGRVKVEKVEILPFLSQIVTLCNGKIDVLDLRSLESLSSVVVPKGAAASVLGAAPQTTVSSFCCGFMAPLPRGQPDLREFRIVVLVKRRLLVYKIPDLSAPVKEVSLAESPLAQLEMRAGHCYMIFKKLYVSVSLATDELTPLLQFGPKTNPCFKLLNQGVLCALEAHGKIVPYQNRPGGAQGIASQSDLEWPDSPLNLAFKPPYLISLLLSSLTVHNITDYKHYQTLPVTPGQYAALSDSGNLLILYGSGGFALVHFKPVESQVLHLFARGRVQEGLDLFTAIASGDPDYRRRLLDINRDAGYVFFNAMQFERAFHLWFDSNIDPIDIISLFPGLWPKDLALELQYKESEPPSPDRRASSLSSSSSSLPSISEESRSIFHMDVVTVLHQVLPPESSQDTKRKELFTAQLLLLGFLENYLQSHHSARLELINLVILKLCVEMKPEKLFSFLTPAHPLPFDAAFACLKAKSFHHAMGRLCDASGRSRQALEIWQQLGLEQVQDREPRISRNSAINSTVSLLSKTTDPELVWGFAGWVLDREPGLGLSIFLSSLRGKEDVLPPHLVLEFLTPRDKQLRLSYLEHLTSTLHNTDSRYHTKLVMLYLDAIIPFSSTTTTTTTTTTTSPSSFSSSSTLTYSEVPSPTDATRTKLIKFLDFSNYYDFGMVLARVKEYPLFEEQVILHSKLGQHSLALRLLIDRFKDAERAERYCLKHSKVDSDVYVELLKLYVRDAQYTLSTEKSERLVNNLGHKIPMAEAIKMLPDAPISSILPYLSSSIQHSQHSLRELEVEKNLLRSSQVNLHSRLISLQRGSVTIMPGTKCAVCQKLIGDRVFVRYPNGTVLHFPCFGDDPQVDPITGRNFLTFPME